MRAANQTAQGGRLQIVRLVDVVGDTRGRRYDRTGGHQRIARRTDQKQLPAALVAALVLLVQIHPAGTAPSPPRKADGSGIIESIRTRSEARDMTLKSRSTRKLVRIRANCAANPSAFPRPPVSSRFFFPFLTLVQRI